ncbi:MAG: ROK family protein [Verrucomicrobiota bacterium]
MSENPHDLSVGIDFGGTSVKIGVCAGADVVENAEPIDTAKYGDSNALIDAMVERVSSLREKHPGIKAVGSGVPGLVDFDRGFVHELTNVPGWKNVPFRDLLASKTGLPALVDNDANCMAYAEWAYGAGEPYHNIVALTLGTGIGGGLVIDDKMYRGSQFAAGEIGQMSIDYKGRPGPYGNTGASEVYMGNKQITEHAIIRYADAGMAKKAEELSPKQISEAAQAGDEIARQIWGDVGEWLGSLLASITWLLNPDAIIVGGGMAKSGELLFHPLEEKMKSMLSVVLWDNLHLIPARFGNEAGIIGSAAQALDAANS